MNEYSNKDALSSDTPEERRDFRLKLTSTTVSLSDFPGDDPTDDEKALPVTAQFRSRPKAQTRSIESRSLASICELDGKVILNYDDTVDDDEDPVPTVLSFHVEEPGLITLERRGFLRSVMIFEQGKRHRATYKTPFAVFEMTVFSRTVENALTADGGTLTLEYTLEFRGAAEQKVRISLEAARIK